MTLPYDHALSRGKRRDDLPSWALSPLAVEWIWVVMLERVAAAVRPFVKS